jgi:hypothetical protein
VEAAVEVVSAVALGLERLLERAFPSRRLFREQPLGIVDFTHGAGTSFLVRHDALEVDIDNEFGATTRTVDGEFGREAAHHAIPFAARVVVG